MRNRLEKINVRINKLFSILYRKKILIEMRKKLKTEDVTIISSNCMGGMIYHDLNLKFLSPTINMYIHADDFIKLCGNLEYYFSLELEEITSSLGYPVAKIGDIKLYLVHYNSFEEPNIAWKLRIKRGNYDNIKVIMVDRDGFNEEMLSDFSDLPYDKVFFTSKHYNYSFSVHVKEFANRPTLGLINSFGDKKGHRYYEKNFDIITFLNGGNI